MSDFGLIYQYFLGRHIGASEVENEGRVLKNMLDMNWEVLLQGGCKSVYFLGLFENSGQIVVREEEGVELSQQNRLPSPFALSNHAGIKNSLGNEADLKLLVEQLHELGLSVLVDFVPNHTGLNHDWIETHANYYVWEKNELVREFSGDVAKLNYENPGLRQEMIRVLEYIMSLGVDGVRCDMAHLIPNSFWREAIGQIRADRPDFRFVAEAYSSSVFDWSPMDELLAAGFDATYEELLFRNVKDFFQGQSSLEHVVAHIEYVIREKQPDKRVFYVMNHDDDMEEFAGEYLAGLTSLVLLLPGNRLVFNGQTRGLEKRLAHHMADVLAENKDEVLVGWPEWWVSLVKLVDEKSLSVSTVKVIKDTLLVASVGSGCEFYCNFGTTAVDLGHEGFKAEQVLWGLSNGLQLEPGQALLLQTGS